MRAHDLSPVGVNNPEPGMEVIQIGAHPFPFHVIFFLEKVSHQTLIQQNHQRERDWHQWCDVLSDTSPYPACALNSGTWVGFEIDIVTFQYSVARQMIQKSNSSFCLRCSQSIILCLVNLHFFGKRRRVPEFMILMFPRFNKSPTLATGFVNAWINVSVCNFSFFNVIPSSDAFCWTRCAQISAKAEWDIDILTGELEVLKL